MPLYEYRCQDCALHFERIERVSPPKDGQCPECGGVTHRMIGAPALQFKGSGWYVNDYGRGNGSTAPEAAATSSESGTPTAPEKATSSKPEAKANNKVA